jgi:hypothetical protein
MAIGYVEMFGVVDLEAFVALIRAADGAYFGGHRDGLELIP